MLANGRKAPHREAAENVHRSAGARLCTAGGTTGGIAFGAVPRQYTQENNMLKAFRIIMKVELFKMEDDKATGGGVQDVIVYEKDFGRTLESIVAEALEMVAKNG